MTHIDIPALDTIDLEILMHRDVHFGGNFSIMINYYEDDGIGVMPDFETERLHELKQIEEKMGVDLSELVLPLPAREHVEEAKEVYRQLREVYEEEKGETAKLLSDLILTEEESPDEEIAAIVAKGAALYPALTDLLLSDKFYDPLYPGYGRAPILAAKCLEKLHDERAILPLFQALGQDNFFTDEAIIHALLTFGEKSRTFLISRLLQKPVSKDNERAAIALSSFPLDPTLGNAFLTLLSDEQLASNKTLALYAACSCSELEEASQREKYFSLGTAPYLHSEVKNEIKMIESILNKKRKQP